jgi:hypothetical protein
MIEATEIHEEELWRRTLRQHCAQTSQADVAKVLGYSAAVINQVLKGTYKGDTEKVIRAVRGAYLGDTVECPVIGELQTHRCIENQRAPYAATNPQRVRLFRACRDGCPYSTIGRDKK